MEGSQEGSRETNMEALAVIQGRDDAVQPRVIVMELVRIGVRIYFGGDEI